MGKYFLSESKNVEERQLLATLNEVINLLYELVDNYMPTTNLIYGHGWECYKLDGEVTMHALLDCYKGIIECFERNYYFHSKLQDKLENNLRRIVVLLERLSDVNCKECTTNPLHHHIIDEAISKQFGLDAWLNSVVHYDLAEALEAARAEIFSDYVD